MNHGVGQAPTELRSELGAPTATVNATDSEVWSLLENPNSQTAGVLRNTIQAEISTPGTGSETALRAAYGHTIYAEEYLQAISDPQTALQAAMDATANGQRLVIPAGDYELSSPLKGTGRTIVIDAYGSRLIALGNHGVFSWQGAYGSVHAVTAIAPTQVISNGSPLWATSLTLKTVPKLARGDIIKIVSDDTIPGARPGDDQLASRRGQFAVIDSVVGTSVFVMGTLLETFSTNVRLAKVEDHAVHVRGLTASASLSGATASLLGFTRLIGPTVDDLHIERSGGAGLTFLGCCTYTVRNASINHGVNNTAAGQYGYGILDCSSTAGKIIGCYARHVRHAYTNDSHRIAANSPLDSYGRTINTEINSMTAVGTSVTAFDTHHASQGVQFVNCQALDSFTGFGLRGRGHVVRGGTVRGGKNAIFIFTEGAACESFGHLVDGTVIEDMKEAPVNVYLNSHNGVRENRVSTIRGLRIASASYLNAAIRAQNATLELWDISIVVPTSLPNSAKLISSQNSVLSGGDVGIDIVGNSSGAPIALFETSARSTVELDRIRVRNTSESAKRTQAMRNTLGDIVRLSNVTMDFAPATLVTTGAGDVVFGYGVVTTGENSSAVNQTTVDIGSSLRRCPDALFTANLKPAGVSITLAPLPVARLQSQALRINNFGSARLTVRHGSTYRTEMIGAKDKVLGPKQGLTLYWTGASWAELA